MPGGDSTRCPLLLASLSRPFQSEIGSSAAIIWGKEITIADNIAQCGCGFGDLLFFRNWSSFVIDIGVSHLDSSFRGSMASYSNDQLIIAARAYYIDQLPQMEVARLMGVSQAKVSRMLTLARDRGLVQITVVESNPRDSNLEEDLKRLFKIDAIVIRPIPGQHPEELRQLVGYLAAQSLLSWLENARAVAIAGGRTIQTVVQRLKRLKPIDHADVIQAMGTVDASPGPFDAVELGLTLSRHWGSHFVRLNTPALLHDADTCARLLRLEQVRHVMGRLAEADAALVGVGTLTNSVFADRGVISPLDRKTLENEGAVGEILGRFYDRHGNECETSYRNRIVSLPLEQLRQIPIRVGITTGIDRADAVGAAICGHLLNRLVIDGLGAQALLEHANRSSTA